MRNGNYQPRPKCSIHMLVIVRSYKGKLELQGIFVTSTSISYPIPKWNFSKIIQWKADKLEEKNTYRINHWPSLPYP